MKMVNVKELRSIAKGRNLKGYSKMRKADLLSILNIEPPTKAPTVKDLRKIAKDKNIKGYYKMKKEDLINILRNDTPVHLNDTFSFEDSYFEPEIEEPSWEYIIDIDERRSRFVQMYNAYEIDYIVVEVNG